MTPQAYTRPVNLYTLTVCLTILAVGALYGGYALLADVTGGILEIPQAWLAGTPFSDYLIPGLFLFVVFGIGSLVVMFALWARPNIGLFNGLTKLTHEHWAWAATFALGVILVLWIVIQYLLLQRFHPLQALMAGLGVVIVALDLLPEMRSYLKA